MRAVLTTIAVFLASSGLVRAGSTAVDHGTVGAGNTLNWTVGFEFGVTRSVTVTHLGRYDFGSAGFTEGASAAIWDLAQTQRVAVVVPYGASAGGFLEADAPANGVFFRPCAPTTLSPGNYVLGIMGGTEAFSYDSPVTMAPGLAWKEGRHNGTTSFSYPANARTQAACYFGPSFKFASGRNVAISSYAYDGTGAGAQPATSPAYPDTGGTELTDGQFPSNTLYTDAQWVGFRDDSMSLGNSHPQVTLDLGSEHALSEAIITYLHSTTQAGGTITAPDVAYVSVSTNGTSFTPPASFTTEFNAASGDEIRTAYLDLSGLTARYVRLDFRNSTQWTFLAGIAVTEPTTDRHAWWAANTGSANAGAFTLGFRFDVNQPIELTALGRADRSGAGFTTAQVRIFDWGTGLPVVTAVITNGAQVETNGAMAVHYVTLPSPVRLDAAKTYLAAVETTGNSFAYGLAATLDDAITWRDGRATPSGSPAMPATASDTTFSIVYTNSLAYLGPNFMFRALSATGLSLSLTSPSSRQVLQRNGSDRALVPIQGRFSGAPDRIEARATPLAGYRGKEAGWTPIDAAPAGGAFSGTLELRGGWYNLAVRAVSGENSVTASVDRVGVGDVFVTAGQSNGANHGAPAQTAGDDRVSVRLDVSANSWRHAADPEPIATGTGGSPWPHLGDLLARANDVPVGFLCVAVGSTAVSQWIPGTSYYDSRLRPALQSLGTNGLKAVLWHQGESDSLAATPAATYAARLQQIITQSRVDAGWAVPWGVALVSWHPTAVESNEPPIIAGQQQVIDADPLVFTGASTDSFHLLGYLSDTVHFNQQGLDEHARQWFEAIQLYLPPPHDTGSTVRVR